MKPAYFFLFLSLSALSQTKPKIESLKDPKTIEDYEHQFRGCPANSECDQVMGLQMTRWNDLLKKIKGSEFTEAQRSQYLELFRAKYGIPAEFYTLQKSQQTFKPLLFNSPCKEHNPKSGEKVLKGIAFLKSLSREKAVIWRDQTQTELSPGETLIAQPVFVYSSAAPTEYLIPLGDQPLFIKNDDLYILKEAEDLFYILRVSKNGEWKVENFPMDQLTQWEEKRSEITCPKEEKKLAPKVFGVEFCKSVWNEDLKKNVAVRMYQGCII
jgi:hypothetical protein